MSFCSRATAQVARRAVVSALAAGLFLAVTPFGQAQAKWPERPIKLVLPTGSLALSRARAAALGGAMNGEDREWPWQGDRVCDGHDPEGNVFQLRCPA